MKKLLKAINKAFNDVVKYSFSFFGILTLYFERKAKKLKDKQKKYENEKKETNPFKPRETLDVEFLAGGNMYNACFAGGALFNATGISHPIEITAGMQSAHSSLPHTYKMLNISHVLAGNEAFFDINTKGHALKYGMLS